MRAALLLLLAAAATGCAHAGLTLTWADEKTLTHDPAKYPDDAAVVLHRSDHQLMVIKDGESYSQYGRHEVIALQTEAGFDAADVKVAFRAKDKLVELRARMRTADGTWEELEPKLLLSDSNSNGERDTNAQFFRFPRIEIGALLEYIWVIESKGLSWADDQESVGQYPVRRYQMTLETSKEIITTISSYNTQLPVASEQLPNKNHRLTVEIHDLPHRPVEDYAPDWTFTEPRWSWRVIVFQWGHRASSAWNTWDQLLENRGGRLFGLSGDLFEGYVPPTLPPCTDVPCKISAARDWLAEHVAARKEDSSLSCRPLKEVVAAQRANSQERAVLLRRLLADQGLDARLAFATRHWSAQTDPKFPTLARFNDMLVYLPEQPGLAKAAWLAPRCDACGLDQLPAELRGIDVLLFNATRGGTSGTELKSEWKSTAASEPAPARLTRVTHVARLDDAGTLTDAITESFAGSAAEDERLEQAQQTPNDVRDALQKEGARASALSRLVEIGERRCDPRAATCRTQHRVEIPAYATSESATRWLVPLNALSTMYSTRLTREPAQRVAELHLQRDETFEEVFDVEALPGFALETVPKPVVVTTPLVRTSVTVAATPTGARVTRTLKRTIGGAPLDKYVELQGAFRAFQDARHMVLSFARR